MRTSLGTWEYAGFLACFTAICCGIPGSLDQTLEVLGVFVFVSPTGPDDGSVERKQVHRTLNTRPDAAVSRWGVELLHFRIPNRLNPK